MIEKICILLLLQLLFFFKTISYKYVSDDIPVWQASKDFKCHKWMRWVWAIEGAIRTNQQLDHFITILIHSINSVLIYVAFGANDVSFIAALLFAFNPINNQGSVWISGRAYALTCMFFLTGCSIKYAWPAVLLMMYFPIGYIMAPALILANVWYVIPVLIGGIIYFKRMRGSVKSKVDMEMFDEDKKIKPEKIILVLKTFAFYTIHAIFPIKHTFYHSFMQSMAGSGRKKSYQLDRYFWIGIILALGILYKFIFMPYDLFSFGLIVWIIGLAPFLNAFRISQEIAERYTYAALPGLMICLAIVLYGHPFAIGLFLGMYAVKLWFWMDAYQDDFYLVEMSCINDPSAWFAWHVKALKRWDVQSNKEAMILWTMAKIISPNEFKVLMNLATMLKIHNQDKEAQDFLEEARRNIPPGQEKSSGDIIKNWEKGNYSILI